MESLNLTSKNIRIATVIFIAALLMSCGSKKAESGSTEEASRIVTPAAGTTQQALAYCGQGTNSTNTMRVNLGAVVDSNNKIDSNFVHAKITNIPATFNTDNTYIAIWKWYAESSGFTYVNNTPVTFKLVSVATGVDLTSYMSTLNWSTIASLAQTLNATTPADFFQKVRLFVHIQDPSAQYDAITVSLHNGTSGVSVNRVDALLPVFHADPRLYAVESSGSARALVLQALHPFAGQDYSLWSLKTFENKANELCAPLAQ